MENIKCEDCRLLAEKGNRHTLPHKNLKLDPKRQAKRISSAMGSADEEYYVCIVCEEEWLHETGKMGLGWVS